MYVFFKTNKDIEDCRENGIFTEIENCVYSELERVGRGKRSETKVAFEFDSDEHVQNAFDGDYFMRLR